MAKAKTPSLMASILSSRCSAPPFSSVSAIQCALQSLVWVILFQL
jgi:hypothetical protein